MPPRPEPPRPALRALIVAAYVAVFCILLPGALWLAGAAIDARLGWERVPSLVGVPILLVGLSLLLWGVAALWFGGGGLPVSALPPPRLTRRGPYRHVRHPIYLGFNIAVLGLGLAAGSRGLAWVVAPLFAPAWVIYALIEERGLVRRFGSEYRRYQRQVKFLPRIGLYRVFQFLQLLGLLPVRASGREHVPRRGPVVLVFNHSCYLDAAYLGTVTWRPVHHLTTAEAYRSGARALLVKHFVNVPVRRYRQDPAACREMLRRLAEGEVIGIAIEGERAALGKYQGALADVAGIMARLGVPVVPVGISGAYDSGPRWSDVVRRRPVRVRAGPAVQFHDRSPTEAIDQAILPLLEENPQPVHLDGLPREKLHRVLWRCPACSEGEPWRPALLECAGCGARFTERGGRFADSAGKLMSLADLGERVRSVVDQGDVVVGAGVWRERCMFGPIEPLEPLGEGLVTLGPAGVRFGDLHIPIEAIISVGTERADTLQVATRDGMWQVRLLDGSAFRLHLAVNRWRGVAAAPGRGTAAPAFEAQEEAARTPKEAAS
jgi:1-acyl-sn-glycerol-3-phosphate acyltransferase